MVTALIVGNGFIVNTIASAIGPQAPTGSSDVRVKVTVPAAISAEDGV